MREKQTQATKQKRVERVNPFDRGKKLARMLRTLIVLSYGWKTVLELSELVEQPPWMIRRDIDLFQRAGVPIESMHEVRRGVGGRYRLGADWVKRFFKNVDPKHTV